jgi:DNA-directed RNA polymerase subunit RPC12/RpoP
MTPDPPFTMPGMAEAECAKCGEVFDELEGARRPCPKCGSTRRVAYMGANLTGKGTLTATGEVVDRAVTSIRLAVLLGLITLGATAGFSKNSLPWGIAWGIGTALGGVALLLLIFKWRWLRRKTMGAMDWITSR